MEFRKITFDNFKACRTMSAGKDGDNFVAPNVISLAQAYLAVDNNVCAPMPFAIYKEETMVGFIMMSYITKAQDDSLDEDIYDIWRFMIDEKHQDKGYGKEALIKAIDFIKTQPKGPAKALYLSYVPGNDKAEALYKKVGFVATGEEDHGEIVMKLDL